MPQIINDLVLPKTSGVGIRVDQNVPSFGYRDITGYPTLRGNASIDPVWTSYRGNISQFLMGTSAKYLTFCFHLPHDYVPNTDLFIHVHWSHISATVSTGSVTWEFEVMYAKGFDQAQFNAPVTRTVSQAGPTGATGQYRHMVAETAIAVETPTGGEQLDRSLIQVDGLLVARIRASANTMDGSATPFLHTADLHYQSTNMATKGKAPDFYA